MLATRLEDTLLPLSGNDRNHSDLTTLTRAIEARDVPVVFVADGGVESVDSAIRQFHLFRPAWIICDSGMSIFRRTEADLFQPVSDWSESLHPRMTGMVPASISSARALTWLMQYTHTEPANMVFAGSSAMDMETFTSGYRCVVVGNADRQVARQVCDAHRSACFVNRLFLGEQPATSGLLEGCRWFGLVDPDRKTHYSIGATPITHNETHFRVWAPQRKRVDVEITQGTEVTCHSLSREDDGFHIATLSGAGPDTAYRFRIDHTSARPDPASRFQPFGVHGPSQIVDDISFPWTDQSWSGVPRRNLVIYELHIGTFTTEGTFQAAISRLPELVRLGVTAIEIMPVAQTPGRWNWGYDGVNLFAVRNTYGGPHEFKELIDACHQAGIAVVLDVVYNHVGPEGNYLAEFGPYFSSRHSTPWGDAFNFDGSDSQHVRQFVIDNVLFWLDKYHLDGLRLDAVHFMRDDSLPSIVDEIRDAVADFKTSVTRHIHLIAEANVYNDDLLNADRGHPPCDAIWSDCLMHSIYARGTPDVRLTDRDYTRDDLAEALQHGWLYFHENTANHRATADQRSRFGTAGSITPVVESFVTALQTHDSVGNHPSGRRLHHLTSRSFQKSAATLMLLYPAIPLIFMGEESASESLFPFFADFEDEQLRKAVDLGRAREFPDCDRETLVPPSDPRSFLSAKLPTTNSDLDMVAWYQKLIAVRQSGLDSGWLDARGMTTDYDPQQQVFSVRYELVKNAGISIHARLTDPRRNPLEPLSFEYHGALLLSSEPVQALQMGPIALHANHAIVVSNSGDSGRVQNE